ncbi:MAG TPA: hypothetical protein VF599_01815 [Pyrinomonadaceae bacterium]
MSALFARGDTPSNETVELTDEFLLSRLSIREARGQDEGAGFVMMPDNIPLFVPGEKMEVYLKKSKRGCLKPRSTRITIIKTSPPNT